MNLLYKPNTCLLCFLCPNPPLQVAKERSLRYHVGKGMVDRRILDSGVQSTQYLRGPECSRLLMQLISSLSVSAQGLQGEGRVLGKGLLCLGSLSNISAAYCLHCLSQHAFTDTRPPEYPSCRLRTPREGEALCTLPPRTWRIWWAIHGGRMRVG